MLKAFVSSTYTIVLSKKNIPSFEISRVFDDLPKKSAYRLWTRTVIVISLLVIVYFISSKQKERKFAVQKEHIAYRSQNIPCSESFSQEISKYPNCVPKFCGRVVIDTLVTLEEVQVLR